MNLPEEFKGRFAGYGLISLVCLLLLLFADYKH